MDLAFIIKGVLIFFELHLMRIVYCQEINSDGIIKAEIEGAK